VILSPSVRVFSSQEYFAAAFANGFLGVKFQPIFCRD
jgi:hypothetical protein